jgi:hypothetical protein
MKAAQRCGLLVQWINGSGTKLRGFAQFFICRPARYLVLGD